MRLVINTGSTSKKYALYNGGVQVLAIRFEEEADGFRMSVTHTDKDKVDESVSGDTYKVSLRKTLEIALAEGVIAEYDDIQDVGIRIVAPGTYFTEHRRVDTDFLDRLEEVQPYAPLHITPALSEIKEVQKVLPHAVLYGVSDSAFHTSIPEAVRRYSIRDEDTREFDIWRFGYHGLSASAIVRKLKMMNSVKELSRVIVCHVGGGVSITAVKDGKSVDTSMGFSPVGGLHMSTRTGDIDPGAVIYLAQKRGFSYEEMREYLNREGGFKGVTGGISDMRLLLDRYRENDDKAVLAMDMFKNRISKYIGSYVAILGGIDVLVLTATVCERSAVARSLICRDLEHFGIKLDEERNQTHASNEDGLINVEEGRVRIAVVHTDEMGEIVQTVDDIHF